FYSYTDAKFTSFLGPDGVDRSSNPFARAPKHIAGATARIHAPIDESQGNLDFGVTWSYQSSFISSDAYDPRNPLISDIVYTIPGYSLWNFDASWTNIMGSDVDATVYVRNIANKKYILPGQSTVLTTTTGAGIVTRTPSEPRAFGLQLRYTFR